MSFATIKISLFLSGCDKINIYNMVVKKNSLCCLKLLKGSTNIEDLGIKENSLTIAFSDKYIHIIKKK